MNSLPTTPILPSFKSNDIPQFNTDDENNSPPPPQINLEEINNASPQSLIEEETDADPFSSIYHNGISESGFGNQENENADQESFIPPPKFFPNLTTFFFFSLMIVSGIKKQTLNSILSFLKSPDFDAKDLPADADSLDTFRYRLKRNNGKPEIINPPLGFWNIQLEEEKEIFFVDPKSIIQMVFLNPSLVGKFDHLIPVKTQQVTKFSETLAARSNSFTAFPLIHQLRKQYRIHVQIGTLVQFHALNSTTSFGQIRSIYKLDQENIGIDVYPFESVNNGFELNLNKTRILSILPSVIEETFDRLPREYYCRKIITQKDASQNYQQPKKLLLPILDDNVEISDIYVLAIDLNADGFSVWRTVKYYFIFWSSLTGFEIDIWFALTI